jgi:RCR-type E3 ubiquitin transferase
MDAEHNITPVEEHFHIDWDHETDLSSKSPLKYPNSAQKITKKIESFSKGIIETLKLDRKSTNPFNIEVDVGAKEIEENISQINGNLKTKEKTSSSKEKPSHEHEVSYKKNKIIDLFSSKDACIFHLLPYIFEVMVPILNDTKVKKKNFGCSAHYQYVFFYYRFQFRS